jgi:DNA modification methylase
MNGLTHKIICGDSTEIMKNMEYKSIDLIVTDPPYGIDYQSAWRIDSERFDKIIGDKEINCSFLNNCKYILKQETALYLFTRWDVEPKWVVEVKKSGFIVKNIIIWDRIIHGLGDLKGCYAPSYDMIIFATKGRHILRNGRPKDIIRVKRVDSIKLIHPNQKPVGLVEKIISNSSNIGDTVLDPFLGSGTTLVAAERLNRNSIGIDISKEWCEKSYERLLREVKQRKLDRLLSIIEKVGF